MRFPGAIPLILGLCLGGSLPARAGTHSLWVVAKDQLREVRAPESPEARPGARAELTVLLPGGEEAEGLLRCARLEDPRPTPDAGDARPVLLVPRPEDQLQLLQVRPRDRLRLQVDDTGNRVVQVLDITRGSSRRARILALAAGFLAIGGLAALATRGRPARFLLGADNRYSNSQVQLVLWFTTVASVYGAAQLLRLRWDWGLAGGVDIPGNLLALSGLSALSFGGAKVITSQKVDNALRAQGAPVKAPAARASLFSDLVQNDAGQADFGDFQMILVTLAAVGIFGLSAFRFLGELSLVHGIRLPDVDTTLLSAFGLGQGAYLLKKAALKAGEG